MGDNVGILALLPVALTIALAIVFIVASKIRGIKIDNQTTEMIEAEAARNK